MVSIFVRDDSPYYYLRVYNKLAHSQKEKRLKIKTTIEVTKADREKFIRAKRLRNRGENSRAHYSGTPELQHKIAKIKDSFFDLELEKKLGTQIKRKLKLSEGLEEYISVKSRVGDKKRIAESTKKGYRRAVGLFIEASGEDKEIQKYTNEIDFTKFLSFMEIKDYAESTRANLTNYLASLWNYFISQGYHSEQIIEIYESEKEITPQDIPLDEFKIILKYYEDKPDRWEWIYYLLLSMCRISTAATQSRDDINFKQKYIRMLNVKSRRKKSQFYIFPLYNELENLVKRIIQRPIIDNSNRLFSHFRLIVDDYDKAFQWWYTDQKKLFAAGLISKRYKMHDIRKTFPSYAINELGMNSKDIQYLLDHADESISKNYYINEKINMIIDKFESKPILGNLSEPEFHSQDVILKPEEIELRINEVRLNKFASKGLNITKKELIKLLKEKPVTKIAEDYKVSDSAIHKLIKKYNIDRKKL